MASSTFATGDHLTIKTDYLSTNYGFIVPLFIPWMHELCTVAATKTLSELPTTPNRLTPKNTLNFETIRDEIIPQLFKFINSTSNPILYLNERFKHYNRPNSKQLTERGMELFIWSLIFDLITFIRYQHQTELKNGNSSHQNNVLINISSLEISVIIQYIILLIHEYHQSAEYTYNQRICCQQLLTILNNMSTHQRLIKKHHQNISL